MLDSSADRSVVNPKLVEQDEYLRKNITGQGVDGVSEVPLVEEWIHARNFSISLTVAVTKQPHGEVLLGRDLGPTFDALMVMKRPKKNPRVK